MVWIDFGLCPVTPAISGRVQPARASQVTAVSRRSWSRLPASSGDGHDCAGLGLAELSAAVDQANVLELEPVALALAGEQAEQRRVADRRAPDGIGRSYERADLCIAINDDEVIADASAVQPQPP